MNKYFRIGLFIFFPFICACNNNFIQIEDFSEKEKVSYSLPDWQKLQQEIPNLPELISWEVQIISKNGIKKILVPGTVKNISTEFPKNAASGILAFPVTKIFEFENSYFSAQVFHPAGAIYPINKTNLLWQQGFPAQILKTFFQNENFSEEAGEILSTFNWQQLIGKIIQNESESIENLLKQWNEDNCSDEYTPFYNPWLLDRISMASAISQKNFSVTKLKFPQAVTLIAENPLVENAGGVQNFLSPYIPENYIFGKVNFLSIIKTKENSSCFLLKDRIAEFSINSDGTINLNLCSIPHY